MSLQDFYSYFYDWADGNEILLACVGHIVNWSMWFWIIIALFLTADVTGKPKWMLKYKVRSDENVPVDKARLWDAIKVTLNYTIVSNAIGAYPIYLAQSWRGCSFRVEDVPSIPRAILEIAFFIVVQEIVFYYSHRLLHHPYLYKRVHKKHHIWTAPIGVAALDVHPCEYLFSNFSAVFIGPILLGSHAVLSWLWAPVIYTITICHHSGYHLPLLPSPEFHDYHHLKFDVNYGMWGPLDWLHGTDDQFRGTIQHERHRQLRSLTPMSVQYPDKERQKDSNTNGNYNNKKNT